MDVSPAELKSVLFLCYVEQDMQRDAVVYEARVCGPMAFRVACIVQKHCAPAVTLQRPVLHANAIGRAIGDLCNRHSVIVQSRLGSSGVCSAVKRGEKS